MKIKKILPIGICSLMIAPWSELKGMDNPNDPTINNDYLSRAQKLQFEGMHAEACFYYNLAYITKNNKSIGSIPEKEMSAREKIEIHDRIFSELLREEAEKGNIESKYKFALRVINGKVKEDGFDFKNITKDYGKRLMREIANIGDDDMQYADPLNKKYIDKARKYINIFPDPITDAKWVHDLHEQTLLWMFPLDCLNIFFQSINLIAKGAFSSQYPLLEGTAHAISAASNINRGTHATAQWALTGDNNNLTTSLSEVISLFNNIHNIYNLLNINPVILDSENIMLRTNMDQFSANDINTDIQELKEKRDTTLFLFESASREAQGRIKNMESIRIGDQQLLDDTQLEINKQMEQANDFLRVKFLGFKHENYVDKELLVDRNRYKYVIEKMDKLIEVAKKDYENYCSKNRYKIYKIDDRILDLQILRQEKFETQNIINSIINGNNEKSQRIKNVTDGIGLMKLSASAIHLTSGTAGYSAESCKQVLSKRYHHDLLEEEPERHKEDKSKDTDNLIKGCEAIDSQYNTFMLSKLLDVGNYFFYTKSIGHRVSAGLIIFSLITGKDFYKHC
jgi:hypothetical protein